MLLLRFIEVSSRDSN